MADSTRVVSTRDILVYIADYSASNALPANTVLWGTTWGGTWTNVGYTSGGVHFSTEITRTDIRVDQELDPILRPATARNATMNTNLSEFSPDNIVTATGQGSVTSVAATTGVRGYDEWAMGSTVADNHFAVGYDILNPGDDEAIRIAGWRWQPTGSPTFDAVPEQAMLIPLNGQLTPDTGVVPSRVATIRDIIPIAA